MVRGSSKFKKCHLTVRALSTPSLECVEEIPMFERFKKFFRLVL